MSRRGQRLPEPIEEEEIVGLPESEPSEDEEGEDIFTEDMDNDYESKPRLDTYDENEFDDEEYQEMTIEQRRAAELEMQHNDRMRARQQGQHGLLPRGRRYGQTGFSGQRLPAAFLSDQDSEPIGLDVPGILSTHSLTGEADGESLSKALNIPSSAIPTGEMESLEGEAVEEGRLGRVEEIEERFDLESIQNPAEALSQPAPRREMGMRFRDFLNSFVPADVKEENPDAEGIYRKVIAECRRDNKKSFEVDFQHLSDYSRILGAFLMFYPRQVLEIFDEVAMQMIAQDDFYRRVTNVVNVRITNLVPETPLTKLRQQHLNTLISTTGVVTRRSAVFSQMINARFTCETCGAVLGPFAQIEKKPIKIKTCPSCNGKGPFRLNTEQTVFRNYQRVTLQESPNALEPGRLPRHKELILVNDLIDCCKPGEEIKVTGIYMNQYDVVLNKQYGFPVFTTQIEANHITVGTSSRSGTGDDVEFTEEEKREIEDLARDPNIAERVFHSFAPAIYGHEDLKRAVCLAMLGGVRKEIPGHIVRGDINVLIVGDPATAKSQILKYVEKTGYRVVRTQGRGASAVGLTAAVRKDPSTGEWTLEGGAMVLANNGICIIDEFDKMNDKDRTSIHEAMEQQTISIAKAGIVAVLQARCAVIAAANPIHSRYDTSQTFLANVDLSEPILSRFDLLCVVKDNVDEDQDRRMARFIVKSHIMSHPNFTEEDASIIPHIDENDPSALLSSSSTSSSSSSSSTFAPLAPDVLRRYIQYARMQRVENSDADREKIKELYAQLRIAAEGCGGTPMTARNVDAIERISEAYAKLRLHHIVTENDVQLAIQTFLDSFISSQRHQAKTALRKQFAHYLTFSKDRFVLLRDLLRRMEQEAEQYELFQAHQKASILGIDFNPELPATVQIGIDQFEDRARAEMIEKADVDAFLKSELFRRTGFTKQMQKGTPGALIKKTAQSKIITI
ncbi:DNA replication licensing factor MCM2 [Monocercomonoides exilis]|uniref:DNA replication licensing factor MCM2 n=1 Tax=Monocercomonoides exilis TaxID=2049356 RepID=UPI00355A5CB9|nr:DNA replication licensing factor MCM2 [Monocercomonoides exilis]|eukprot:MONOS_11715.1-p1 / transcript=MONOS_11715.1 / gene=MONOS_11715 / organism=Monocercomonoides_exilis_PA203 / gene_product=DNA replication licensing factor MCM2 / transcript_product=DNA replication licensing factor MCM2 / location=Mono_scaffold00604:15463-18660(-) / protein_length=961 / sequence_SO=supercontig / SO=protein_coding / is_pseudo=false